MLKVQVLCKLLRQVLPPQVAVTRAWPRPMGYLVSQFESREDLIEALLTSCHIPWWCVSFDLITPGISHKA